MDKQGLREIYSSIVAGDTALGALAFRLRNRGILRRIRGRGHSIAIHRSAVLRGVRFHIRGRAHLIRVGEG